ncbi:hypothetical protein KAH55_09195 [bacterium]|nr:hypothetical protein [bacterium]
MKKLIFSLLLIPVCLMAQAVSVHTTRPTLQTRLYFQNYRMGDVDASLNQVSMPLILSWPIRSDVNVQMRMTPGSTFFDDESLAGLSDLYVNANYLFWEQRIMAGVGVGVPTGTSKLDQTGFQIARLISNNAFRFQLPTYGQGMSVNGGLAMAYPVSDVAIVGAGLNYIFRNKYEPVAESHDDYNPGDLAGANMGIDFLLTEQSKFFMDLLFTYYFPDYIAGQEVFEAGTKFNFEMGYFFNSDVWTVLVNGVFRQRGKNDIWNGASLTQEIKNSNGPQFELGGTGRYQATERLAGLGFLELRAFGKNEYDSGAATIVGLGGGVDYAPNRQLTLDFSVKLYFGQMSGGEDDTQSVNGFELTTGCIYQF